MSEIQKYIKILNIECPRCLDTKILWKGRENVFWARMDGRGDYDVMNCDKCSGGGWNRCSYTTDIYARGIHAFHVADGEWHVLETLRPIIKPYLDNIAHIEAQAEAERIKQAEADRIQEELIEEDLSDSDEERIRKEKEKEDDENPMPLWSYYNNDDFDKKIKSTDIAIEIGKIAERMYEVIKLSCGDILELTNLIKELKMDLKSSMESSTSNKTELKQIENSEGRFKVTYVKLYISNQIENTSCDCLEWCGFNTKEAHFSLQYTVYKPRNIAAKKKCDEDMSKLVMM